MNRIFFVLLFSLLLTADAWGQGTYWEEVLGPYGGGSSVFTTNTNLVYATHATSGGVYRSEDYGEQWEKLPMVISPVNPIERLHIGHSGVFYKLSFTGSNKSLFRSLDEGATWMLMDSNTPVNWLHEARTGVLIGNFTIQPGLYRSINGGLTWEYLALPNIHLKQNYSLASTTNGYMVISQIANNQFFLSTNNGLTWTEQNVPAPGGSPQVVSSGTLFSITTLGSNTIHRSTDGGITWASISISMVSDEAVTSMLELNSSRLLLSTNYRIYYSDDDGITWHAMPPSETDHPNVLLAGKALSNGDILGRFGGNSLSRSSDGGATWSFSSYGIRQATVQQLHFASDSLQLAVTPDGLWRTEDAGYSWERLLTDTGNIDANNFLRTPLAVLNRDSLVVGLGPNLWKTTDGGASFSQVTPPNGLVSIHNGLFATSGNHLFCSDSGNVIRSADLGATWTTVAPNAFLTDLVQHPTAGLFAVFFPNDPDPEGYLLHHSPDGGATWTRVTSLDAQISQPRALAVGNDGSLYVTGIKNAGGTLAVSKDAGATWTYKPTIDSYFGNGGIAINNAGLIFAAALEQGKVIATIDEGETWYCLPNDTYGWIPMIGSLPISPSGHLYVIPVSGAQYRTTASTEFGAYVTGQVRRDADAECSTPDAQAPLKNWVVSLEGANNWYANTNADGRYTFFADTGAYTVRAQPPQSLWWGLCEAEQTIQSDSLFSTDTVDFAALALAECPLLSVSVGVPLLRRCFDNNATVQYCNQGTETADSAWVDVILDEFLDFVSAGLPHEALGNNTYRFHLGSVPSGECGQFSLVVYVDCDSTVLGQTHCIAAHGYPDTLCVPLAGWSGATVVAEAECQDTVVALRLRNISPIPSQVLPYIIIEDDVVLFQGQDTHAPGGAMTFERPANGRTWRIESQQEPGHPFSTVAVAFLEGCGGFESLGFVNQFEVNTFTPSWDQVCIPNSGAFDPNDKQGFPLGYGAQHRIRPGQELDYLIRFQNTGTDTAFNVFIRDTLSPWLDPASVRPGASSHPYTWTLSSQGALQFTFANILLPDSNVNLAGSQGFVRFRVAQRPDVPIGTQIFNEAGIYFDFNAPVITNRTLHTVGVDDITSIPERPEFARKQETVLVSSNPALEEVVFQLRDGVEFNRHRIVLTDALGRVLRDETATGARHVLQRKGLPAGACFFRVEDVNGRYTGAGKVWWR